MNTPVLTAGRLEFEEIFKRLEREFKMTKASVARALRVQRSYVTMLIHGDRTPHIRTLESMRALEKTLRAGGNPEGPAEEDTELNRIFNQLRMLEQNDRPKFEAVRQVVDSMAQQASAGAGSSSKPAGAASKLLKKAAASVRKPVLK